MNRVGVAFFTSKKKMSLIIGIDPGWASFGLAVTNGMECEGATSFTPRDKVANENSFRGPLDYLEATLVEIDRRLKDYNAVYMERYVAYKGVQSQAAEDILMFIGAVKGMFECRGVKVNMVRAIDWKPRVCKYLVRTKGFNNPDPSFDKKYSVLAAKELSGLELKSNHEADAICMSYLGVIDQYNLEHGKK